jgi:hypothetical protein
MDAESTEKLASILRSAIQTGEHQCSIRTSPGVQLHKWDTSVLEIRSKSSILDNATSAEILVYIDQAAAAAPLIPR